VQMEPIVIAFVFEVALKREQGVQVCFANGAEVIFLPRIIMPPATYFDDAAPGSGAGCQM
jgi:hypothetical protein